MGCGSSMQGHCPSDQPWVAAGISRSHYDQILAKFVQLDANGDHKLNRKEFEQASRLAEFLGMEPDDISYLFEKVDVDHSGDISFKEFLAHLATRKDHLSLDVQVNPEKERLKENMKRLAFNLSTTDKGPGVPGDGNCQFYSLSWKMFSTTSRHGEIRSKVIEHLRGPAGQDIAAFYAPEHPRQPKTFEDYLNVMAKDMVWGDQLTLQTAANLYNVRINVLTSSSYLPSSLPQNDINQTGGRKYGAVELLVPQGEHKENSKDIWIAFAAQHYSPIDPSSRTPKSLFK